MRSTDLRSHHTTTLATYCILALAGVGSVTLPESLPAARSALPAEPAASVCAAEAEGAAPDSSAAPPPKAPATVLNASAEIDADPS